MTIFQVTNSPNGYANIKFDGIDMASILNNGDLSQLQGGTFEWNSQQGNGNLAIPDCPFFIGTLPIFRTDKIIEIVNPLDVNSATFKVNDTDYTALFPRTIVEGSLDIENSAIRYFRNGRIMTIDSYVFCGHMTYPSIFKISELNLFSFVTEDFAQTLMNCGLNNLELNKCNVSHQ